MYNGRGSILYHAMYLYWLTIRYWERSGLPIKTLFQNNHTLFSEESGEIALSVLSNAQPVNTRRRIQQTRTEWQLVRMRYNLNSTQEQRTKERKRRLVGYSFFFSLHLLTTQAAWWIILPVLDKFSNTFWIILPNC